MSHTPADLSGQVLIADCAKLDLIRIDEVQHNHYDSVADQALSGLLHPTDLMLV